MNPRIKSMICYRKKQKTTNQNNNLKKKTQNKDSVSTIWDNFKRPNIHITRVPVTYRE